MVGGRGEESKKLWGCKEKGDFLSLELHTERKRRQAIREVVYILKVRTGGSGKKGGGN